MVRDLDIRLVRHFVAVAEELHFTRAAARVFVSQQNLSRDVRKLEDGLGIRLFDRNTRQVTLTADGERFLPLARSLLARHDDVVGRMTGTSTRFVVDVVGEGTTPARVLAAARGCEDGFEYYARFTAGMAESVPQLEARQLDVAFGRWVPGQGRTLRRRLVRREPLALLVPHGHPLAGTSTVALRDLRNLTICCRAGDHVTPEWEDLAHHLLDAWGARPAEDHPYVRGAGELAHHVRPGEPPVLTLVDQPSVPGASLRPLVDPVPVHPWSMVWTDGTTHPGLVGLHAAVDELTARNGWDDTESDTWMPTVD